MKPSDFRLPPNYAKMVEAINCDPPSGRVKEALELQIMGVCFLNGPAWNDEHLGRLLAWAMLAGFPECSTTEPMSTIVLLASYRFAIRGGCVPDFEQMETWFIPYVRELWQNQERTSWLPALMDRYGVTGWEKIKYREWHPDLLRRGLFSIRQEIPVKAKEVA